MRRTDARLEEGLEKGVYYLIADGFRTTSGEFELSVRLNYEEPDRAQLRDGAGGRVPQRDWSFRSRTTMPGGVCSTDLRRALGWAGSAPAFSSMPGGPGRLHRVSDRGDSYDTVLYLQRGCGGNDEIACHDDIGRQQAQPPQRGQARSGRTRLSLTVL